MNTTGSKEPHPNADGGSLERSLRRRDSHDAKDDIGLRINGRVDASSQADLATQSGTTDMEKEIRGQIVFSPAIRNRLILSFTGLCSGGELRTIAAGLRVASTSGWISGNPSGCGDL